MRKLDSAATSGEQDPISCAMLRIEAVRKLEPGEERSWAAGLAEQLGRLFELLQQRPEAEAPDAVFSNLEPSRRELVSDVRRLRVEHMHLFQDCRVLRYDCAFLASGGTVPVLLIEDALCRLLDYRQNHREASRRFESLRDNGPGDGSCRRG